MKKNQDIAKLLKLLDKLDKQKKALGIHRDRIKATIDDIEDIIECADLAHDDLEDGIRSMRSGLDALSQYI